MINKSLVVFYIVIEIIKYKRIKEIGLFIFFFKFMNFNYINFKFYVVCYDKVECVVVRIFYKIIRFMYLIIWYMYNVNMIVWFLVVVVVVIMCIIIIELFMNWDIVMEFFINFIIGI